MQWQDEFGDTITWNPGEPWPTEDPEKSRIRQERHEARLHGGYWCSDGEHYTFSQFVTRNCCDRCQAAVDRYCDRL